MKSFTARYLKNSNLLFTCEHASGRIPRRYKNLGLRASELNNAEGDWYDIGAAELANELSALFDASYLFANFSRLLIDCNRRLDTEVKGGNTFHTAALKEELLLFDGAVESKIPIPGNCVRDARIEEKKRWDTFVRPYLEEGLAIAERSIARAGHAYVVQVHSFSPIYNGEWRDVDLGIIYHPQIAPEAQKLIRALERETALKVGDNKPWGIADVGGGIFGNLHGDERATLFTIEVKNTLLQKPDDVKNIARSFARSFVAAFPEMRPVADWKILA